MEMKFKIVYEDDQILVANKSFGVLSQQDRSGEQGMDFFISEYLGSTAYSAMMQRLDRVAGGLMLFAKSNVASRELKKQFDAHTILKEYLIITERTPAENEGNLVHYLKKIPGTLKMRTYDKAVKLSKRAELIYSVLGTIENRSLIKVYPVTGRQHQIRLQMSRIGCTVVGDKKYGKTEHLPDKCICLYSYHLNFKHPVSGKEVDIVAEYPNRLIWNEFEQFKPSS